MVVFFLGEFDNEDGVFAGESNQHNESDLGEDVVVASDHDHSGEREQQAQRHDEDDRERKSQTFILCREHEENEQDTQRVDVDGGVSSDDLLVGQVGPLEFESRRQHLLGEIGNDFLALAGTERGNGSAVQVGGEIAVVVQHSVGSKTFGHFDHGTDGNHVAGEVAGLEASDVFDVVAKFRLGLGDDLIGATESIEIVYVEATEIDLKCFEQARQGNALRLCLLAVYIGFQLGDVDGIAGVDLLELTGAIGGADQSLGGLIKFRITEIAAILDHEFEASRGADAVHRWRGKHEHHGILDRHELAVERSRDRIAGEFGRLAFFEIVQAHENDAAVRAHAEAMNRQAREGDGVFHAGLFQHDVRHLAHDGFRAIERCAIGQLGETNEVLFVLSGHEPIGHHLKTLHRGPDQSAVDQQSDDTEANESLYQAHVDARRPVEESVERTKDPTE